MRKLLKALIFIFVLFIPMTLGIFTVKKFFPEDFNRIKEQSFLFIAKKIPKLAKFLPVKKTEENKEITNNNDNEKVIPIEEQKLFFTNKDVYKAICGKEEHINLQDKFIGCNRCPNYMETQNADYFSLNSYAFGSVIKKGETEAVVFMNGCEEDNKGTAIILRNGYGGWQQVSLFKNISFDKPPLVFTDSQGFLTLVGKKETNGNNFVKETLFTLNFKNNKINKNDIFSSHYSNSLKCSYQFTANIDEPKQVSENKFLVKLDVMGWQDSAESDCKIPSRHKNVHLKPGTYTLEFTQKETNFVGDKKTQKIMTELEKAQE